MKIFAIAVFRKKDKESTNLAQNVDVSSFGYFQRGSVQEFIEFFMKTVASRTEAGTRTSVEEQNYVCHCQCRLDNLECVVVADKEYPSRVAFGLIAQIMDDFSKQYPKSVWVSAKPADVPMRSLETTMAKYQNPAEADKMMKIQQDLDETKVILHKTIESVLERGEKIDTLVERSEDLSRQSKVFYTQAKKTNQCCDWM